MSIVLGIVDYGQSGNIKSVFEAIAHTKALPKVITRPEELLKVDKIILPGVGSFKSAIHQLKSKNLFQSLIEKIQQKPTLGICLGMHILCAKGFEDGQTDGLGLFDVTVEKIKTQHILPHVGFNRVEVISNNPLINVAEYYYFMHSYGITDPKYGICSTKYNEEPFFSGIQKNHIFGVQFHPEKSRMAGLKLLENFIDL
jgi:imidazole glycerol-phosphate synthase subunit HisH